MARLRLSSPALSLLKGNKGVFRMTLQEWKVEVAKAKIALALARYKATLYRLGLTNKGGREWLKT